MNDLFLSLGMVYLHKHVKSADMREARSACTFPSVCATAAKKKRESAMHIERNSEDDLIVVTDHVWFMYWFLCYCHSKAE